MRSNSRPEPPPARGSHRIGFNGTNSTTSLPQGGTLAPQSSMARKMIVPQYPGQPNSIPSSDGTRDPLHDLRGSGPSTSAHSLPILPYRAQNTVTGTLQNSPTNNTQVLRKTAPPPIPNKKPSLLSKASSPNSTPAPSVVTASSPNAQRYRDDPPTNEGLRQPPPPKRSMAAPPTMRKPLPNLMDDDFKPALPPRTGTGLSSASNGRGGGGANLMDDEPEDLHNLKDWEVLRPMR